MKLLNELFGLYQAVSTAIFSIQGLKNIEVNCEALYRGEEFRFYVVVFGESRKKNERTNLSFVFYDWGNIKENRRKAEELLQAINKDDFSQIEALE